MQSSSPLLTPARRTVAVTFYEVAFEDGWPWPARDSCGALSCSRASWQSLGSKIWGGITTSVSSGTLALFWNWGLTTLPRLVLNLCIQTIPPASASHIVGTIRPIAPYPAQGQSCLTIWKFPGHGRLDRECGDHAAADQDRQTGVRTLSILLETQRDLSRGPGGPGFQNEVPWCQPPNLINRGE